MTLTTNARTDVGKKRDHNEDDFLCDEGLGLYIVCDGMGGHAAGEVASKLAVETIAGVVRAKSSALQAAPEHAKRDELARVMRHAVEMANSAVHGLGKSKKQHYGAGTTCSALLIQADGAALAHVGDSRVYLSRAGTLSQLSNDHTFVAEAVRRGMLSEAEAADHSAGHMLTRAVGPQPEVHVDTLVFDVLPGDTLLLCSDGLHNYCEDPDELRGLLDGPIDGLTDRLVDMANERGGEDNITAVALRAQSPSGKAELLRTSNAHKSFDALRHIALMADLSIAEVMLVAEALTTEVHAAGTVIVEEGATSAAMYVIVSGSLEVRRAGKPLAFLDSGSHFGEMALLTNSPRSATVRAASPSLLLVLRREKLYELVQKHPLVGVKFLWRLAQVQSMRLDDATMPMEDGRIRTVRLESFPSPFSRRKPEGGGG